jgi:hypothetical protein
MKSISESIHFYTHAVNDSANAQLLLHSEH